MSLWRYLLAQSTVLWVLAIVIPRERKLLLPCLKELRLHKNPAAQIIKSLGYFSLSVCWFPKVYTCFFGFGFHGFFKLYYEIFLLFLLQFQIFASPSEVSATLHDQAALLLWIYYCIWQMSVNKRRTKKVCPYCLNKHFAPFLWKMGTTPGLASRTVTVMTHVCSVPR